LAIRTSELTAAAKSDLGYELLAVVNAGRLKVYANDGTKAAATFWEETRLCRYAVAGNAAMSFFVDPRDGHDDFVVSLALCVRAAARLLPQPYSVVIPPRDDYAGEGPF
jgi:hypothetical protein